MSEYTGVLNGLGSLLTGLATYLKNLVVRNKAESKQEADILSHTSKIEELENNVKNFAATQEKILEAIASVASEVKSLAVTVNEFKEEREARKKIVRFKQRLDSIALSFIDANKINNSMSAMILEGSNAIGDIFADVAQNGIENVDLNLFRIKAIATLKKIRSQYVTKDFSSAFSERIKTEVAYPLLKDLELSFRLLSNNHYNGHTEEEFDKVCVTFVRDFISQSLKIYEHEIR